jgi:hypothetical protein
VSPSPSPSVSAIALIALATAAAATGAQAAGGRPSAAQGLFYERALMSRADARCHLFSRDIAAALASAREQARGAALRAGDSAAAVEATRGRALAKADAVDGRPRGRPPAAAPPRDAFASYAKLFFMRFPGPRSAWQAERPEPSRRGPRWDLVEALPGTGGWLLFGTVGGAPALLDARRDAQPAATAWLVARDPARWAQPVLADAPPAGASLTFVAESRAAAAVSLLPAGATRGTLYRFPAAALDALSALDPRETARVELAYPAAGRERTVSAPLEVGDLAAARAFLATGGAR